MSNKGKKVTRSIVFQGGILAAAGILCRLIGVIRRVPLQNIIGDFGNGYYSAAYEFYAIILILSSYSLPAAISKLIAQRQSRGQYKKMQKVFKGGLVFALISGGIFSLLVFFMADFFAGTVMKEPMSTLALRILAPTILIVAVMAVFRGYFQGLGVMHFTALSQILEQIILVAVSLIGAKILFGVGTKYGNLMMNENYAASLGAAGATIGCGVGALSGLLLMIYFYLHNKNSIDKRVAADTSKNRDTFGSIMLLILQTALPMILCSVLYNVCGVLDQSIYNHHMVSVGMEDIKSFYWGVYSGKYKLLITLPIAVANSMCSAIIPSLTASIENKDYVAARSKMSTVIRVTMIISIPSAFGLAILGKPIVASMFSGEIDLAAIMLAYGSISVIFFSLSTLGSGILQGLNKLIVPVINSAIALVIHLLALLLMLKVFNWGIHSVVVANLLFAVVVSALNHFSIYRTINYKQELKQTFIIPIISSAVMGLCTFGTYKISMLLIDNLRLSLVISILVAVIVYFVTLVLLKGVNEYDLALIPFGNKIYRVLKAIGIYKD